MREVSLKGIGLFCTAGTGAEGREGGEAGKITHFRARQWVEDRKALKLMSRSVRLGVAAVKMALDEDDVWSSVSPERRAMMVGTTPLGGDAQDLVPALEASTDEDGTLHMGRFGTEGRAMIHPLWLVRGLSNNVLGLASAFHDFQGVNSNYCSGDDAGARAVLEGYLAVAEGRADVAVCGGSDSFLQIANHDEVGEVGEGAAFFLFGVAEPGERVVSYAPGDRGIEAEQALGSMGAAGRVVALARAVLRGEESHMGLEGTNALHFPST